MSIIRFGIDLAKNSFAICGVDSHEKIVLRKTLKREKLLEFFANIPAAMVAMEAGSGAYHWARELLALGHDARIIDPRLVAPYRHQGHSGKNDFNDAIAICEAAGRPQMRFIPVKSKEQQAILLVHRLRQACVAEHTRLVNRLRGPSSASSSPKAPIPSKTAGRRSGSGTIKTCRPSPGKRSMPSTQSSPGFISRCWPTTGRSMLSFARMSAPSGWPRSTA